MSTRCTVTMRDTIDDPTGYSLYRHSDGYPDSVLPELSMAFEYAKGEYDAADFAAALVTAWKVAHAKLMAEIESPFGAGGAIYLAAGRDEHDWTRYHYDVYGAGHDVWAQCYQRIHHGSGTTFWRRVGKPYRIIGDRAKISAIMVS